jgi:cytochrome b6-f complex iron-sulfur subunit
MAKEKLSTAEILALARKQDSHTEAKPPPAAGPADQPPPETAPAASAESAAEAPTPAKPKPATAPKGTADILAAARAQGAGKAAGSAPAATTDKPAQPAAATSGAKPKSTADILAAARAQGGPGAAKPTADKPAPEKKASPKAPPKTAASEHPSVQEMVRAMHEGKPAIVEKPNPKLPGKPPLPKAPAADAAMNRRAFGLGFLSGAVALVATPFAAAWTLMAIIGGLWSLLTARFMMPNIVVELPSKFPVGPPSDFPMGTVSEKYKTQRGVWIVHSDAYNGQNIIFALRSVCTHLGCTPNWLEAEQKFKCPCHGSGFYISGINFEGPAPRPLERIGLRLDPGNGLLIVDKSVKFQEELGQWKDEKSFVPLA